MVAALVVFLPGTVLAVAVLELAAGQMVSGSSRLVSGAMQLALLTFGIIAGIQAVGVSTQLIFSGSSDLLGDWAPWLGVLVFAVGRDGGELGAAPVVPRPDARPLRGVGGPSGGERHLRRLRERVRGSAGHDPGRRLGLTPALRHAAPRVCSCQGSGCSSPGPWG